MIMREICASSPVIPVLAVENADYAEPLAMALYEGGLRVFEVTLRTPVALEVIKRMRNAVPEAVVGVGTLMTQEDIAASKHAGAQFGVAPGMTPSLLEGAEDAGMPLLPGVSTPSEVMMAREFGHDVLKFFPAEANGGVPVLKAWASPLSDVAFCPTGGITPETAKSYLDLPNVLCVGGSWITPKRLMEEGKWKDIRELAEQAARF